MMPPGQESAQPTAGLLERRIRATAPGSTRARAWPGSRIEASRRQAADRGECDGHDPSSAYAQGWRCRRCGRGRRLHRSARLTVDGARSTRRATNAKPLAVNSGDALSLQQRQTSPRPVALVKADRRYALPRPYRSASSARRPVRAGSGTKDHRLASLPLWRRCHATTSAGSYRRCRPTLHARGPRPRWRDWYSVGTGTRRNAETSSTPNSGSTVKVVIEYLLSVPYGQPSDGLLRVARHGRPLCSGLTVGPSLGGKGASSSLAICRCSRALRRRCWRASRRGGVTDVKERKPCAQLSYGFGIIYRDDRSSRLDQLRAAVLRIQVAEQVQKDNLCAVGWQDSTELFPAKCHSICASRFRSVDTVRRPLRRPALLCIERRGNDRGGGLVAEVAIAG